jgi:hypothetical protein
MKSTAFDTGPDVQIDIIRGLPNIYGIDLLYRRIPLPVSGWCAGAGR